MPIKATELYPTAETRVHFQAISRGVVGGKNGIWACFYPSTSVSSISIINKCSILTNKSPPLCTHSSWRRR